MLFLFLLSCSFPVNDSSTTVGVSVGKELPLLPIKEYYWKSPPILVNCTNTSILTRENITEATDMLPFDKLFLAYVELECEDICSKSWGNVTITSKPCLEIDDKKSKEEAFVSLHYIERELQYAIIVQDKKDTKLLLHELNHSLGYSDASAVGNIMNPRKDLMGFDTQGITY